MYKMTAQIPDGRILDVTPPAGYPLSTIVKWQEVNLPSLPAGTIVTVTKL